VRLREQLVQARHERLVARAAIEVQEIDLHHRQVRRTALGAQHRLTVKLALAARDERWDNHSMATGASRLFGRRA